MRGRLRLEFPGSSPGPPSKSRQKGRNLATLNPLADGSSPSWPTEIRDARDSEWRVGQGRRRDRPHGDGVHDVAGVDVRIGVPRQVHRLLRVDPRLGKPGGEGAPEGAPALFRWPQAISKKGWGSDGSISPPERARRFVACGPIRRDRWASASTPALRPQCRRSCCGGRSGRSGR